jgi:hypothetical protein
MLYIYFSSYLLGGFLSRYVYPATDYIVITSLFTGETEIKF